MSTLDPKSFEALNLIELVERGAAPYERMQHQDLMDTLLAKGFIAKTYSGLNSNGQIMAAATPVGVAVYCDMFGVKTPAEGRAKRLGADRPTEHDTSSTTQYLAYGDYRTSSLVSTEDEGGMVQKQ